MFLLPSFFSGCLQRRCAQLEMAAALQLSQHTLKRPELTLEYPHVLESQHADARVRGIIFVAHLAVRHVYASRNN